MNKLIEEKWVTAMQTRDLLDVDKYKEPTVNWSGVGPVDTKTAREFAKRLIKVCDRVDSNDWD